MSIDSVGSGGSSSDSGIDNPTFTLEGLGRELKVGDVLTADEMKKIEAASNNNLHFDGEKLFGINPQDGSPVELKLGEPIISGKMHDLHHSVPTSGGDGNSNGHHAGAGSGSPGPMSGM